MENIEHLYEEYAQTVYKYLFSLSQNADLSEELTQETFYQAMKTIHHFRGECKISVWLCQIAKHLWYNEINKKNKTRSISIDDLEIPVHTGKNVEAAVLQNEEKLALFRMLHRLDEKTKEVMYLRLSGDLSFSEIGDILGQSETWARVTFYRGKQKMMKGRSEWNSD
ncbi:RNA polymerase subunit sigma [Brevibacillus reuszeri]|uniref:RNA polymerase subunit sigma n=1 Tax=Brevibacillus reuszeri TaxID=54915 RepID=A0A0K9YYV3_9BACL|nr:sigma-70 family RNA polymerase sigma factor [Brevibacillus reuszeri]KNB73410.1 RNA polymerase subunit sigma [Brevibacillus reuszeri]MED1857038.1 sigma-70 family RNA polymerase sigma factor [Brevibacillus reuszeri]GED68207.1 RNA polymerase subunit sigma [Brevibacillus reuszeri]